MNNENEGSECDRQQLDLSDESDAKIEMQNRILHQQVLRKLPRAIFAKLSDHEKTLLRLIIAGDSSAAEVAEDLGMSVEKIARGVKQAARQAAIENKKRVTRNRS